MKEVLIDRTFERDWVFKHIGTLWACALPIVLAWVLSTHFGIAFNLSHSLPQKVWLIRLSQNPVRGDYVLFKAPFSVGLGENGTVIKQVIGVPGDEVLRIDRDFFINGSYVARAKAFSRQQEPLEPGPQGLLAEGQYYVWTPHKDSFDSRYAKMGWMDASQLLGVAYALW
ncbi:MAG: S26 family signal peptidase [Gammaproteobacteria bacterium]|nr:S26 family signal peptidase [Gammaproteobacteria bacterium]